MREKKQKKGKTNSWGCKSDKEKSDRTKIWAPTNKISIAYHWEALPFKKKKPPINFGIYRFPCTRKCEE